MQLPCNGIYCFIVRGPFADQMSIGKLYDKRSINCTRGEKHGPWERESILPIFEGIIEQHSQRGMSLPAVLNVFHTSAHPPPLVLKFLLQLEKPLGAAGEHATAGRYVAMLRSSSEFDHSFPQVPLLATGRTSKCDYVNKNYRHVAVGILYSDISLHCVGPIVARGRIISKVTTFYSLSSVR